MTRLIGPDESCRLVYVNSGTNAGKAKAQGMSAPLYADLAGTTAADVQTTLGTAIPESTVIVDAYSKLPLFLFPDGVDTIYTSINGGPIVPLYARIDDRLDSLAAAISDPFSVNTYGADPTGVTDSTAAFNAALAAMPTQTVTNANGTVAYPRGVLALGAGTYKIGSSGDVNNLGPFASVSGFGTNVTVIDYRGTNQAFRVFNSVRPVSDTFLDLGGLAGTIDGITIDGANSSAGAAALKYGDVEGGVLGPSLVVRNFDKAGSTGILFWNEYAWTENVKAWANIFNCTTGVKFHGCAGSVVQNGFTGGDNSFMYNDMTFKVYAFGAQDGVTLENGATYQGGALRVRANMANAASLASNAFLRVTGVAPAGHLGAGTSSQLFNCYLELQGETNGPGNFGPYTIYFGDPGANYIVNNIGILAFSGAKWRLSNWSLGANFANGSFTFQGYVSGDTNLAPADGGGGVVAGAQYLSRSTLFADGGAPMHQGDFLGPTTLTQNMTIALQSIKAGPQRKTIIVKQAASGGPYTVTWPTSGSPTTSSPTVIWSGGTAPTMSTTADATDVYLLDTTDGATWYGRVAQTTNQALLASLDARYAQITGAAGKTSLIVATSGGDYTTIDAALTAAAGLGGADIFVKRGVWTITATLTLPSNTTLRGEGAATEIKEANNAGVNMIYIPPTSSNVIVKDLKLNGNRANNTVTFNGIRAEGSKIRVLNVHVTSANGYNLVAWVGSSDVHFASCVSEDARDEGIEFMGCNRGSAVGNHVRNIGKNAVLVWGNIAQGGTSSGIVIADNIISGAAAITTGFAGIKVDDGATDVTITGNVILAGGTSSPGIRVDSNSANVVSNITVTGNTVVGSTAEGILVGFSNNVVVANNAVRGCATAGIKLTGATCTNAQVVGNTSSGNTLYGLYADTVTGPQFISNLSSGNTQQGFIMNACTDVTVTGNRIVSNGGVLYGGMDATNNTGGTITNNTVRQTGSTGISVQGSSGITVGQNNVSLARSAGIFARDCTKINIVANVCRNNGYGGNTTLYNGIMIYSVSSTAADIIVANNRCYDDQGTKTQGYGLRMIGASDNIQVSGNMLSGNSVSGFGTDGTQTNVSFAPCKKLTSGAIGTSPVTVAHGLPYTPQTVQVSMTSAGTIWRSAASDATNIYLTADAAARTADVMIG